MIITKKEIKKYIKNYFHDFCVTEYAFVNNSTPNVVGVTYKNIKKIKQLQNNQPTHNPLVLGSSPSGPTIGE